MAKRSCRRTTDENLIHKKAVEMRKKADEQHEVRALIVEKPVFQKPEREQRGLSRSFS